MSRDNGGPDAAELAERGTLRRNYLCHGVEGGLFLGALTFVNANTLLPAIVQGLGGPAWLVSLMPSIMYAGMYLPPIFTVHLMERLHRYKPLLLVTGTFQRLPYLLAALALLAGAEHSPRLALAAVALAPLISGVAGGLSVTAWQQLVLKTVPDNRRSSMFAIRYLISSIIGIAAGYVAKYELQQHPGAIGYGILHLLAFAMLVGSYIVFSMIRERPHQPPAKRGMGLIDTLAAMPALVHQDRRFALYLVSRFLRNGVFILTPFLAIHFQQTLGRAESYLGQLLIVQMVGAILGNMAAGWVGDRFGGKITTIGGTLLFALLALWACLTSSSWQFQAIFFLFGIAFYASDVGSQILGFEVCPEQDRTSYLALITLVTMPGMVAASWISAALWEPQHRFVALAVVTMATLLVSVAVLIPLKEPRHEKMLSVI